MCSIDSWDTKASAEHPFSLCRIPESEKLILLPETTDWGKDFFLYLLRQAHLLLEVRSSIESLEGTVQIGLMQTWIIQCLFLASMRVKTLVSFSMWMEGPTSAETSPNAISAESRNTTRKAGARSNQSRSEPLRAAHR